MLNIFNTLSRRVARPKKYPPTPEILAKREARALTRQRNYERCIKNNPCLNHRDSNNWLLRPRFMGFDPASPGSDMTVVTHPIA
jgi:hypothetical protein